jgi:tetratricopeptide (TPR) repeat protein
MAGAEARAERYDTAASWQRHALELCQQASIDPDTLAVVELTLGSYQLHLAMKAPDKAEEAALTLESVVRRTRGRGLNPQLIQAKTGLATARALQGRHADAALIYLRAARTAIQTEPAAVYAELVRSAGDFFFAAGERTRALSLWRATLSHLDEAPGDYAALDDHSVVRGLIDLGLRCKSDSLVDRYHAVLERLTAEPGTN